MSSPPVTVAIGDDSGPIREALTDLIEAEPGLELVGVGGDTEEVVALCSRLHPTIVILDVKMPKGGGVEAALGIRHVSPTTRVIAYSAHVDAATRTAMAAAGAAAFVAKGGPISELVSTIARVLTDPGDDHA